MKNRAKCKLCNSIVESFHPTDHVICKCGEIELNGGDAMYAKANDFRNFVRVDDLGNEITVRYENKKSPDIGTENDGGQEDENEPKDTTHAEAVKELHYLLECENELIKDGVNSYVTRTDLYYYMLRILKIFKSMKDG